MTVGEGHVEVPASGPEPPGPVRAATAPDVVSGQQAADEAANGETRHRCGWSVCLSGGFAAQGITGSLIGDHT